MKIKEITKANALFQQWQALLTNRTKRTQTGTFLVQGVRPINIALAQNSKLEAVLYSSNTLSDWANDIIKQADPEMLYRVAPELMKELGEKDEDIPELLLVAKALSDTLPDISLEKLRSKLILVLDRPQNPGNIGAILRSADALGAALVIVTGHAADIYDPKSVRASRGSLFALPVVRAESSADVLSWLDQQSEKFEIIGLSEDGDKPLWDIDLTQPTVAVIGNETWGLSRQWNEMVTQRVVVPMQGSASSLNAASSAALVLYEYARQLRSK